MPSVVPRKLDESGADFPYRYWRLATRSLGAAEPSSRTAKKTKDEAKAKTEIRALTAKALSRLADEPNSHDMGGAR
jgi:hypothetical protein